MIFELWPDGRCEIAGRPVRAVLGRGGVKRAEDKIEGDGATPAGLWPLRRVLYRPDREPPPRTALPVAAIGRSDGWCDAPEDAAYNRPVVLPYPASAEAMWRQDGVYDLVLVIGHNDDPPIAARGSAIFVHLQRPDVGPTEGCIALRREDLLALLAKAHSGDSLRLHL